MVRDELESSAIEMLNEYDPIFYKRRSSTNSLGSGGIADKETMNAELVSDGVIAITPNAERNKDFNNFPGWGMMKINHLQRIWFLGMETVNILGINLVILSMMLEIV